MDRHSSEKSQVSHSVASGAVPPVAGLGDSLRSRREQLGWSQARLARQSGVSRTVVNEVERGRRSPSLGTYDKLRTALRLDLSVAVAWLPSVAPAELSERFLTTLAAALVTGRRVALTDLAAALESNVSAVRAGIVPLAGRLAAVGLAAVDDGVQVEVVVLAHAAEQVGRVAHLDAVRTLSPETLMALVIIGHLGEATRREVEDRRGADSAGLLDRLVERGLLAKRTDQAGVGRPNAYRLTARTLTVLGHTTLESFQAWCHQQVMQVTPAARVRPGTDTLAGDH